MNVKLNICPCCGGTEYSRTFSAFNGAVFGICINCEAAIVLKSSPEWEKECQQQPSTKPSTPTVTCPYCQSTDTKKISGTSRFVSVGLFGLASSKAGGKQWHCTRCKSDF